MDEAASDAVPVSVRLSARRGQGAACSLALHAVMLLLALFILPALRPPPEPIEDAAVMVDLVQLGDRTASPPHPEKAPLPQEAAPEHRIPEVSRAAPARVPPAGAGRPRADARPAPQPSAADDFDARLRAEERAQRRDNGRGQGERSAASTNGARAPQATYSVKDFVRAQIVRRWNFDVAALGATRWVVAIHVTLAADGTVDSASIVEDPRYRTDPAYQALARSARNAALVSSPLQVPPGLPAASRDMVLEFDPRAALR